MKARIIVISITLLVSHFLLFAQQKPQYTQYIFNNYLLNPAISGIENYADIKVGHRSQWSGFDGAPKTSFVSAHWSLSKDYLWANPLSLPNTDDDPMSKSYTQNYTSSPAHHGMGLVAVSDKLGPINTVDAGLTYAYHLQTASATNLSVGVYAGITKLGVNLDEILLEQAIDPAVANLSENQFKPDLAIGLWFYGANFFVGLSAQRIISQNFSFIKNYQSTNNDSKIPHLFFTTGHRFFIDEEISALPSVMVKKVGGLPINFDSNLKISFKDKLWLGASYRNKDSFAALVGLNVKNLVNVTYAYDMTTSKLNKVNNGSHEIVLGVQLQKAYKVFSGGKMW